MSSICSHRDYTKQLTKLKPLSVDTQNIFFGKNDCRSFRSSESYRRKAQSNVGD